MVSLPPPSASDLYELSLNAYFTSQPSLKDPQFQYPPREWKRFSKKRKEKIRADFRKDERSAAAISPSSLFNSAAAPDANTAYPSLASSDSPKLATATTSTKLKNENRKKKLRADFQKAKNTAAVINTYTSKNPAAVISNRIPRRPAPTIRIISFFNSADPLVSTLTRVIEKRYDMLKKSILH